MVIRTAEPPQDKNLVRYHFGGLDGLKKAYFSDTSHCPPLFRSLANKEQLSDVQLPELISDLLRQNFEFFLDNPEMRELMLWQLSESDPVLRKVHEQRENELAKLLALTDAHFARSGISFRAVLALLLSGICFTILYANHNVVRFMGIDIKKKKDRESLLQTMDFIIRSAWHEAEQNKIN